MGIGVLFEYVCSSLIDVYSELKFVVNLVDLD
jgi:hypothetical protein